MGSENLFHKRKNRSLASYKREKGKRQPYDVILIVTEGEKTEPNYFNDLCRHYGLHPANVVIKNCPKGADPVSIVKYAIEQYKLHNYDKVFCVFDKEHTNYEIALRKIQAATIKKIPIKAITSVPCIEYWFLLHFEDTAAPYQQKDKKSPGDQLKSKLKKYIPAYQENSLNVFEKTKDHLSRAIERAKRINRQQQRIDTDNPSTKVYELVEYLLGMKKIPG